MNMSEWTALLTLSTMIVVGVTKAKTWIFVRVETIDLGTQEKNNSLQKTVKSLFLSSLFVIGLFLLMFILTKAGAFVIEKRLTNENDLQTLSVQNTPNTMSAKKNEPYLGAIVRVYDKDQSSDFRVIHFESEVLQPVRVGILYAGAAFLFVTGLLLVVIFLITTILSSTNVDENNS